MAVGPHGPWITPGESTADSDDLDDEAEWRAAFGETPEPSLITGTAVDEFSWIYRALSRETTRHGAFAPDQIDQWDITTVAVLLGVGLSEDVLSREFASWQEEYEEWKREEEASVSDGDVT